MKLLAVQKAVYGALSADSTLMGMITSLSDDPDQNAPYPYVLIGDDTGNPEDLLIETGTNATLTIHFWDRDAPMSRVKGIMDQADQTLHHARLNVIGSQLVDCLVEFREVGRDVDTIHGVMRVRVITFG